MPELPVPAKTFFRDFEFSLENYSVSRGGVEIGTFQGMTNREAGRDYIAFLYGDDVQNGDWLSCGSRKYLVSDIEIDTYRGKPEMVKAFY